MQDDDHEFYVALEAFLRENSTLPQKDKTSLQPSIIQALDLDFLASLEDQNDEKLQEIKQEAKMEIRRKLESKKEKKSIKQEITEEEKEEWHPPPLPLLEDHFTFHPLPFLLIPFLPPLLVLIYLLPLIHLLIFFIFINLKKMMT